jgi:hypothetical protein
MLSSGLAGFSVMSLAGSSLLVTGVSGARMSSLAFFVIGWLGGMFGDGIGERDNGVRESGES